MALPQEDKKINKIALNPKISLLSESLANTAKEGSFYYVECVKYQPPQLNITFATAWSMPTQPADPLLLKYSFSEHSMTEDIKSSVEAIVTFSKTNRVIINAKEYGCMIAAYILVRFGYTPMSAAKTIAAIGGYEFPGVGWLKKYVPDYDTIGLAAVILGGQTPVVYCTVPGVKIALRNYPNSVVYTFGSLLEEDQRLFDSATRVDTPMPYDELLKSEVVTVTARFDKCLQTMIDQCHRPTNGAAAKTVILCDYYTWQRAAAFAVKFLVRYGSADVSSAINQINSIFRSEFGMDDPTDMYGQPAEAFPLSRKWLKLLLTGDYNNRDSNTWVHSARCT